MLQEVYGNTGKEACPEGQKVMTTLPATSVNLTPCEMTECIYCLNNHYCGRIYPPRNGDGYCKDFVSIND
ncbi:hypothetical protein MOMUL_22650 [Moorella mulderi DSM 14980]|uniref:Uncharacterized protein n=1 Tax=Moorella mulderi DSM 14980 TaxID=1122241 RepID=A0A151AV45_9FIRM|nr:hypothetical protein MOMUL_22650 [Moorella mulderi DSM 14980]